MSKEKNVFTFEEVRKKYPQREIENVFKIEDPIFWEDKNLPPKGCLIRDRKTGEIQCHVCGGFFDHVGFHLARSKKEGHRITAEEYKQKFSLTMSQALCSERYSKVLSERFRSETHLEHLNRVRKPGSYKGFKKRRQATLDSLAYANKHGICPDQIQSRWLVVADTIGKRPGVRAVQEHDPNLYSAIRRKHGNYNNFLKSISQEILQPSKKITKEKIIACFRRIVRTQKRRPKVVEFYNSQNYGIGITAIYKRFGSFRRALVAAGVTA